MTVISHSRGHRVIWVYEDTHEPVTDDRPCPRCGRLPTLEGHDACLGTLPGVKQACCGHGVVPAYVVLDDGTRLEGHDAEEYIALVPGKA